MSSTAKSWEEALLPPSFAFTGEEHPVVQAKRALLPELDPIRPHPEPGPIVRPRHHRQFGVLLGDARKASFEFAWVGERPRLVRGPGADLAVARPRGEIGVGLVIGDERDDAFDADLPLQRFPVKAQRCMRVRGQLLGLAALEIGVKYEAPRIRPLQQHRTQRGDAVAGRCGERHCFGQWLASGGPLEPAFKWRKRLLFGDFIAHPRDISIGAPPAPLPAYSDATSRATALIGGGALPISASSAARVTRIAAASAETIRSIAADTCCCQGASGSGVRQLPAKGRSSAT